MTYNPNIDSGMVELKSWVQISSGVFTNIDQSIEYDNDTGANRSRRNYAQLVHQVNSPPTIIEGSVYVDSVGINGEGVVKTDGENLKVKDTTAIAALSAINTNLESGLPLKLYSSILTIDGNDTYFMLTEAGQGTIESDEKWQVSKITDDGTTVTTKWADGNTNFDNAANDPSSLSYSY